jgi:hypothetical protein
MLTFFRVERTFYKLRASITAELTKHPKDGHKWEAQLLVTYDRRIVQNGLFTAADLPSVNTPEGAEAWMSRPMGEQGSWLEAAERHFRASETTRKAAKPEPVEA